MNKILCGTYSSYCVQWIWQCVFVVSKDFCSGSFAVLDEREDRKQKQLNYHKENL